MRSLENLSAIPAKIGQVSPGMVIACYNNAGGVVINSQPLLCSCGDELEKLRSKEDPGSVICCSSVRRAYNLPEVKKRATGKRPRL